MENHEASATQEPQGSRTALTAHTPGAMRAARAIGETIQSSPNPGLPGAWPESTYRELASLIDDETGALDMLAALQKIAEYLCDEEDDANACARIAIAAIAKATEPK